jgi:hypothetical protein
MSEIQRYIVDAFSKHDWSLEQDNFGVNLFQCFVVALAKCFRVVLLIPN